MRMFHRDRGKGNRRAGTQLCKAVEIGGDDRGDTRIPPGRLMIAHQHDGCAIAQDLYVPRHDGVGRERENCGVGKDPLGVRQTHPHAIEAGADHETGFRKALPQA